MGRMTPGGEARGTANWLIAILVAGVAALAAGCTSALTTVSRTDTDPPLFVHNVQNSAEEAAIEGFLSYLEAAGCFVIESDPADGQAVRNVPVWPPGTEPERDDGDLKGVVVPGFGLIALGDWVSAGGGYASPETSNLDLPEVSPDCLSPDGEFAMVHSISAAGAR
jgi:hypothetical protein